MISLRQHAISLVAVFLALALGLFLGSGFVGDRVNSMTGTSRDRIGDLEEERDRLNEAVNAANSFDAAIAPRLIANTLNERRVLVLSAPNADDADLGAVQDLIAGSGGTVAGQIGLTDELVADRNSERLATIIDQTIPSGSPLRVELTDSGGRSGDLLGALTMQRPGGVAASDAERRTGLTALRDGGFITYPDNAVGTADLAVIVSGDALGEDSGAQGQTVARLAAALSARGAGGALLGRSGSATGGSPIAVVRSDPGLGNILSTVDNIDQQTGRITSILALAAEAEDNSGAYGTGPGAQAITVGAEN